MIVAHIDIPPSGHHLTVEIAKAMADMTDSVEILVIGLDDFRTSAERAEEAMLELVATHHYVLLDEETYCFYPEDELNSKQFKSPPDSLRPVASEMLPGVDFPLEPG